MSIVKTNRSVGARLPKHVLGDFKKREQHDVNEGLKKAQDAIGVLIAEGVETAMGKYN